MAKVGEVMICNKHTEGKLQSIEHFNGKAVSCIGGGYSKLYVVDSNGLVSALSGEPPFTETAEGLDAVRAVTNIKCGKLHSLFLTEEGFVFSWGQGTGGVLGHGGASDVSVPSVIKTLSGQNVVQIACGEVHSLALTASGDVYAWGLGYDGQLGIRPSIEAVSVPKYVFFKKEIVRVACGEKHSLAVDLEGKIYSWGEGRCGQLGRGKQRDSRVPGVIESEEVFTEVQAGAGHSLALTENGRIYAWGLNNYGQLGTGNDQTCWKPTLVERDFGGKKLKRVSEIACSTHASYCLDIEGRPFSWGKGYIGHGGTSVTKSPKNIEFNTENRVFSGVYVCSHSVLFFAPLRVYSMSPNCGPVSGETRVSMMGTAFTHTDNLKVRFRFSHYEMEVSCRYDSHFKSLEFSSPCFSEVEDLDLPLEAQLDVTMDGIHYVVCESRFLIYDESLYPTAMEPKCASVAGNAQLKLSMNLDMIEPSWLFFLTVGFLPKPKNGLPNKSLDSRKEASQDESQVSLASAKQEETDWVMTSAYYKQGEVICRVPSIEDYDPNNLAYMIDVSLNGQQFSKKPLNFRYYDVEVQEMVPNNGRTDEGTTLMVVGKGLYDSSAKKLRIQSAHGEREISVQWDRKDKRYICVVPPVNWILSTEDPDPQLVREITNSPLRVDLTLNGLEYIKLPNFYYIDPVLLRVARVKFDESLTPEEKEETWLKREPPLEEEPEAKAKREQEEDQAMNTPVRPGTYLYLYTEKIIKTPNLTVQFLQEGARTQAQAVFKNNNKLGVVMPDIGDLTSPTEVSVQISLNGQSFSKELVSIKYVGSSVPEEAPRKRR